MSHSALDRRQLLSLALAAAALPASREALARKAQRNGALGAEHCAEHALCRGVERCVHVKPIMVGRGIKHEREMVSLLCIGDKIDQRAANGKTCKIWRNPGDRGDCHLPSGVCD